MNPIETFLQEQTWTFAKSMPKIPHEYIVRIKVGNDELFSAAVKYIREVMAMPEVEPLWFQIPMQISNATSPTEQIGRAHV